MKPLHIHTPLLQSHPLTRLTGKSIYLKMENCQPSGAFKDRGIGALCQHYANEGAKGLISSSGGNAGLAAAYAGQILKIPVTVIVPITTPASLIQKIADEQAKVIVQGENWDATDVLAQAYAQEQGLSYVPPFNNPIIWKGYETLVQELKEDNNKPDALIVAVGGGGLYCGMVQGLRSALWDDVTIITAETIGAASLYASMQAKQRVILDEVETIATTLAAKQICQQAFDYSQTYPTKPQTVTDKEAVNACLRFADDHRMLVEPSCGAPLALLYDKREVIEEFKNIVVIVCGGSGVSLELLREWRKEFSV